MSDVNSPDPAPAQPMADPAAESAGRHRPDKSEEHPLGADRQFFERLADDAAPDSLRDLGPLTDAEGDDIRQYTGEPVETEEGWVVPRQQNVGPGNMAGSGESPDPSAARQPGDAAPSVAPAPHDGEHPTGVSRSGEVGPEAGTDPAPLTAVDLAPDLIGELTDEMRTVAAELPPLATWNVLVAFADSADARRVLQDLETAGVEGAHLSYLAIQPTEGHEDSSEGVLDNEERVDADAHTMRSVGAGAAVGGASGALGGALTGMALMLIPGVGTLAGIGVLGAAIGGAAAGGNLGLVWGSFRRLGASAAWERTFASVEEGRSVVGVHTDDEKEMHRALDRLPVEGRHVYDRLGEPVDPPV